VKVAVLGVNDVALVALDAIMSRGEHEAVLVVPWAPGQAAVHIEPSPLNELNFGYPGVEESFIDCNTAGMRLISDWKDRRNGLYKAGLQAFTGTLPRTSDYRIVAHLAPLLNQVETLMWAPEVDTLREMLEFEIGGVDAIVNVLDRASFCGAEDGEHTFLATRVWWSTTKGPSPAVDNVVYNVDTSPAWAIASNIDGRKVAVWDHEPPFDDVHHYDLPTRMVCSCVVEGIDLHVGRWATYRPTTLARAYEEVVEFLHNPLSRLNDSTLEMEAIDGEPPSDT
jgi:hypothetical protein